VEFAAGLSAVSYMQGIEDIVESSAATLSVQRENLPQSVERFFSEWKDQRKDIEKLQKDLADLRMNSLTSEDINGVPVAVHELNASPKELMAVATSFANKGGVGLIIGGEEKLHVVSASGTDKVDASEVVKTVCNILGGRGGGKKGLAQGVGNDRMQVAGALSSGKELIKKLLE
jgi:alanyl-tRNA synthetase